ncbi:MAG: hypothetical protein ACI9F9_000251 [Candidatus Paceibacteria bacterium]|jgi:hypothetical protein
MLISALAAAVLMASAPISAPVNQHPAATLLEGHGKLNWFEGSYEDALARAASSNKIVFIDFWTDW